MIIKILLMTVGAAICRPKSIKNIIKEGAKK